MGRTFDYSDKKKMLFLGWQSIMFLAIAWTAIEAPMSFVMKNPVREHNAWWDALISLFFIADIIVNYRMDKNSKESPTLTLDNFDKEHRPYHKSAWLPLDIFASIPFDVITYSLGVGPSLQILRYMRLARVVRIFKLFSIFNSVPLLPKAFKVFLIVSGAMIIIHWIACGWMALNPEPTLDPTSFYIKCLYWAVTTLTTIGYGDITPTNNLTRIYTMIIMIMGVGTYGIVIGNVSRMIMQDERHKEEKKAKFNELTLFMKHYNIPFSLQKQVFSFYGHLLNKKLFDGESKIVAELPQALQNELLVYKKIKLIKNAPIFQGCTTACLKMIAEHLKQEVFSPGKAIINKGDEGNEMYIIGHGEVEVVVEGSVVATLNQGQYFGEIALLEHTVRNADIRSKAYCDLYVFEQEDFDKVVDKYPALHDKFISMYKRRESDRNDKKKAA